MRKSTKLIVVAGALAALTVPSTAMADAPDRVDSVEKRTNVTTENMVAYNSSRFIQNGVWVSGHNYWVENGYNVSNPEWYGLTDQTTYAGSRGNYVQSLLGHEGTSKPSS